jgi:hypothetical protein
MHCLNWSRALGRVIVGQKNNLANEFAARASNIKQCIDFPSEEKNLRFLNIIFFEEHTKERKENSLRRICTQQCNT